MRRRKYTPQNQCALYLKSILLLVVFTLMSNPASAGKIYKWVDAEGVTHYTQHPPKDQSIEKEQIKIKNKKPHGADEAAEKLESNRKALLESAADRKTSSKTDPEDAERQEAIDKNCQIARDNLKQLKEHARVREAGEDGELRYLSEEEHQKRKDDNAAFLQDNCS